MRDIVHLLLQICNINDQQHLNNCFKRLSTIEVNDKVDITFSDADVLVFDDEGNRVYA
nr:hypothetical protein [Mycoplasmopsis bovis]